MSAAPAAASSASIASIPFAYAIACLVRSSTPTSTPSAAATSGGTRPLRVMRSAARDGAMRGPESEPPPSSAPRRYAPAAARSPDDPPRRPLDRGVPRVENPGLDERVERALVAGDVELVARCPVERLPAIGADLGADPELPQERERAPSGRVRRRGRDAARPRRDREGGRFPPNGRARTPPRAGSSRASA